MKKRVTKHIVKHASVQLRSLPIGCILRYNSACDGTKYLLMNDMQEDSAIAIEVNFEQLLLTDKQTFEPHACRLGPIHNCLFDCVAARSENVMVTPLGRGGGSTTPFIHSFIHSFIHLFIHPFLSSFLPSFIHLFIHSFMTFIHSFISVIHSFIHSFIRSFIHSFIHSFIRSFIVSFIHLFIHSLIYSFVHSFIHSFVQSLSRSFIRSFVH